MPTYRDIDRQMDGWMDGWMDGRTNIQTDAQDFQLSLAGGVEKSISVPSFCQTFNYLIIIAL